MKTEKRVVRHWSTVLLMFAAPLAAVAGQSASCENELLADVDLVITPGGGVYMPAMIGDRQVLFQLAISSGLPMIHAASAHALGLTPGPLKADITSGGRRLTQAVQLDELKIGNFKLVSRGAPLLPSGEGEAPAMIGDLIVAGRMGSTLFRNVDAEIHLAASKMKLFKPYRCRGRSPVYWDGQVAELPMRFDGAGTLMFSLELDGQNVEASLLSGVNTSTIDSSVTSKYFGFDENSPGTIADTAGAGAEAAHYHPMSLTAKGISIRDARIRLRPASDCRLTKSRPIYRAIGYSDCMNVVPFRLGSDLLSRMRIYISVIREKIYVSTLATPATDEGPSVEVGPPP